MNERGFSLIEVLISATILSVGILGFARLQVYMEQQTQQALLRLNALNIAENRMENLYADSLAASDEPPISAGFVGSFQVSVERVYLNAVRENDTEETNYAQKVKVNVSWVSVAGKKDSVELISVIEGANRS